MQLIWPVGDGRELDRAELIELYRPERLGPRLRVNFVTSVDGAVEVEGHSAGLGSTADREVFGLLRMFPDALLVGAGTVRNEKYHPLRSDPHRRAWRDEHGLAPHPVLVIASHRLDLDPHAAVLAQSPVRPIILTHAAAPVAARTELARVADVVTCGDGQLDLAAAVTALHARGLTELLCEGGPTLFGGLSAADLVDEVCLTVAPLLAGPGAGRIINGRPAPLHDLGLAHVLADAGVLLLRYVRPRQRPVPAAPDQVPPEPGS